jgi:methyltransferase (TIGR00027 family)
MSMGVHKRPSRTARGVALFRAMASFDYPKTKFGPDYMATYFLPRISQAILKNEKARRRIKSKFPDGMYELFIARTTFFDALFTEALHREVPQIVILGAGYDTRAYRFAAHNPGTVVFELDISTTQGRKISLLKKAQIHAPATIKYVPVDFNEDLLEDVLEKYGFDGNKQAFFLMEGVTYYLEPESIERTLAAIKSISRQGASLAFDYVIRFPPADITKYYGMQAVAKFMARSNPRESPKFAVEEGKLDSSLAQRGFTLIEHLDNSEIEKRYLFDENDALLGHILGAFRFALAKSTFDNKNP